MYLGLDICRLQIEKINLSMIWTWLLPCSFHGRLFEVEVEEDSLFIVSLF